MNTTIKQKNVGDLEVREGIFLRGKRKIFLKLGSPKYVSVRNVLHRGPCTVWRKQKFILRLVLTLTSSDHGWWQPSSTKLIELTLLVRKDSRPASRMVTLSCSDCRCAWLLNWPVSHCDWMWRPQQCGTPAWRRNHRMWSEPQSCCSHLGGHSRLATFYFNSVKRQRRMIFFFFIAWHQYFLETAQVLVHDIKVFH